MNTNIEKLEKALILLDTGITFVDEDKLWECKDLLMDIIEECKKPSPTPTHIKKNEESFLNKSNTGVIACRIDNEGNNSYNAIDVDGIPFDIPKGKVFVSQFNFPGVYLIQIKDGMYYIYTLNSHVAENETRKGLTFEFEMSNPIKAKTKLGDCYTVAQWLYPTVNNAVSEFKKYKYTMILHKKTVIDLKLDTSYDNERNFR